MQLVPLFAMGGLELLILAFALLVLFVGPKKLPRLARSTGSAIGEFKKGRTQAEQEVTDRRDGHSSTERVTETNRR